MTRLVFKMQGMDCLEEVTTLRRAVGPLIGGADRLTCDLLQSTMTVLLPEETAHPDTIIQAVRKTGMQARLWQDTAPLTEAQLPARGWQRWGRPILCLRKRPVPGQRDGMAHAEPGQLAPGPERQYGVWSSHAAGRQLAALPGCHYEWRLVRGAQSPLCACAPYGPICMC